MPTLFNRSPFSSSMEIIKYLILATCSITIGASLLNPLFHYYFHLITPYEVLALSWQGVSGSFFLWQPVTYLFVHGLPGGFNLSLLIELLFNMYMLWIAASALTDRLSSALIFKIYLIAGVIAAAVALPFLYWGFGFPLSGAGPAVFAILALWTLFWPENELLLLGTFTVKLKWLTLVLLGTSVALDLSIANFPSAAAYLAGAFTGYIYGMGVCGLETCYSFLSPIDNAIKSVFGRAAERQNRRRNADAEAYKNAKIFDIKSGDPQLDDDAFMDAMLHKISLTGEKSLSKKEKTRMKTISEKKARHKEY